MRIESFCANDGSVLFIFFYFLVCSSEVNELAVSDPSLLTSASAEHRIFIRNRISRPATYQELEAISVCTNTLLLFILISRCLDGDVDCVSFVAPPLFMEKADTIASTLLGTPYFASTTSNTPTMTSRTSVPSPLCCVGLARLTQMYGRIWKRR